MAFLSKEDILKVDDMRYHCITIPEWGGDIRLKTMSLADQLAYEEVRKDSKTEDIIIQLVKTSCVDENGKQLFSDEEVKQLNIKSAEVICRIFQKCLDINAVESEKVEKQAKN